MVELSKKDNTLRLRTKDNNVVTVSPDLLYVTNSLKRVDVLYTIGAIGFARNYELADILCRSASDVSKTTKELCDHGMLHVTWADRHKVYSLSPHGENILLQLRIYHGTD